MKARFQAWLEQLGDKFWLRPAIVVLLCIVAAQIAVWSEDARLLNMSGTAGSSWGYSGGAEGARALLSAVASSSIGVATTIFSITIASLSLASGQMGPRLLRNFVRDSRNQIALGVFVGTFAYALVVLRTVRTQQEGVFIPHAAVSGAIVLAFICIGTIVWFVHHVVTSINVEKVVDTVHQDLIAALEKRTSKEPGLIAEHLDAAQDISSKHSNFLLAIDADQLADWAKDNAATVEMRIRPGDYVPTGMAIARVVPRDLTVGTAIDRSLTFGRQPAALQDVEYSIRQLTEIAVRALSPGINDPFTAGSVLDRFGDALCRMKGRHLATGVVSRDGKIVLVMPLTDYPGLCDAMFHTIRQSASSSAYVLIRMLDVLANVAEVENDVLRQHELRRHAAFVADAGRAGLADVAGRQDLERRIARFEAALLR